MHDFNLIIWYAKVLGAWSIQAFNLCCTTQINLYAKYVCKCLISAAGVKYP